MNIGRTDGDASAASASGWRFCQNVYNYNMGRLRPACERSRRIKPASTRRRSPLCRFRQGKLYGCSTYISHTWLNCTDSKMSFYVRLAIPNDTPWPNWPRTSRTARPVDWSSSPIRATRARSSEPSEHIRRDTGMSSSTPAVETPSIRSEMTSVVSGTRLIIRLPALRKFSKYIIFISIKYYM